MRISVVDRLMAGYSSASWAIGVLLSDCITKDTPTPFHHSETRLLVIPPSAPRPPLSTSNTNKYVII